MKGRVGWSEGGRTVSTDCRQCGSGSWLEFHKTETICYGRPFIPVWFRHITEDNHCLHWLKHGAGAIMGESGYSLVNSRTVPHRMTFAQQNLFYHNAMSLQGIAKNVFRNRTIFKITAFIQTPTFKDRKFSELYTDFGSYNINTSYKCQLLKHNCLSTKFKVRKLHVESTSLAKLVSSVKSMLLLVCSQSTYTWQTVVGWCITFRGRFYLFWSHRRK